MIMWLDAQLSPLLAKWIREKFNIKTFHVRELGLKNTIDKEIFEAAKKANAAVITKDIDFKLLQDKFGAPPKIIWLTCGNTSNKRLQEIFSRSEEHTSELQSQSNLV